DGTVLAEGGNLPHPTAEVYNPATGIWSYTGSMVAARSSPTATLLPDGRVLVAGGSDIYRNSLTSAELYDPASRTWTATGSMAQGRQGHTATLLTNGKVLVAGGVGTAGFYLPNYPPSAE